jgi:excisionase family DNA binding protein
MRTGAATSVLGESIIRLAIRKRRLRAQKVGRRVLVKRSNLETFLEANPIAAMRDCSLAEFVALCHKAIVTKDEFKKMRESAGHTQASLADAMGVHLRTVWRWELGETIIPKVVELALRYVAEHVVQERDAKDLKLARAALKEAKRKGTVPWEKVKNEPSRKPRRQKH